MIRKKRKCMSGFYKPVLIRLTAVLFFMAGTVCIAAEQTAMEHLISAAPIDIGTRVDFEIKDGKSQKIFWVTVPASGLLYFTADDATRQRELKLSISDAEGRLLGEGGARLTTAGTVLATFRPRSSYQDKPLHVAGRFGLQEKDFDAFEPNDTLEQAPTWTLSPETPVAGGPVMFFPDGDVDCFRLKITVPGYLLPSLYRVSPEKGEPPLQRIRIETGEKQRLSWNRAIFVKPGNITIQLRSEEADLDPGEIEFRFVPNWDECEPNDRKDDAYLLTPGIPVAFSLYPDGQDQDWFALDVPDPGYIVLAIGGMPTPAYDPQGQKLIRGLEVQIVDIRGPDGNSAVHAQTHGSIFINTPVAGRYHFGIRGNFLQVEPIRTMEMTARLVQPAAAINQDADFAIIGVYGEKPDRRSALELALLSSLGAGGFSATTGSKDLEQVVRTFLGATKGTAAKRRAAENQQNHRNKPADLEMERLKILEDHLAEDPLHVLYRHQYKTSAGTTVTRLEKDLSPELKAPAHTPVGVDTLSRAISERLLDRRIKRLEKKGPMVENKTVAPAPQESSDQQPSSSIAVPGQNELERLHALQATLDSDPKQVLFRHSYRTKTGDIIKRLESGEQPELAPPELHHVQVEKLTPRVSRRLLTRAIQGLE